MKKQPEVTARTRSLLLESFWNLYRDHPIEKIRIEAIAKGAGYNRSTFYEYFEDIYDILRQAEEELISQFQKYLKDVLPVVETSPDRPDIVKALVKLFDTYGDRIMILVGDNGDSSFQNRLEEQAQPLIKMILSADAGPYTKYLIAYAYGAIVGVLKQWCKSGRDVPEEDLISAIYSMVSAGALPTARRLAGI
ncbi:MAG: TetR/AcrR family transcriptional regulator [Clostridia bacterium]|nr:TetR/AcrR family transcriptional regulator [Clostridia bacterium]